MGTKTRQFDSMITFYRDVLNLAVLSIDDKSGRFKLDNGTEVHVYGPNDGDPHGAQAAVAGAAPGQAAN